RQSFNDPNIHARHSRALEESLRRGAPTRLTSSRCHPERTCEGSPISSLTTPTILCDQGSDCEIPRSARDDMRSNRRALSRELASEGGFTAAFFAPEDREAVVRHPGRRDQVGERFATRRSPNPIHPCAPNRRQGCNARRDCSAEARPPFDNGPAPPRSLLFRATDWRDWVGRLENQARASVRAHNIRSLDPPHRAESRQSPNCSRLWNRSDWRPEGISNKESPQQRPPFGLEEHRDCIAQIDNSVGFPGFFQNERSLHRLNLSEVTRYRDYCGRSRSLDF